MAIRECDEPMPDGEFDVPVVLMIFNRPEHTRAVFERVAAIRPRRLFVIADGPRPDRPDDVRKCADSRAILDQVNWSCELNTNFAERNLGCRGRTPGGLDWVFGQVDRAIILEDDTIPDPSFFRFCAELLERYADDGRVRTISGNNFLFGQSRNPWSYHFSNIHNLWGWATWRRSWLKVDWAMRRWPEVRDGGWLVDMVGQDLASFWIWRLEATYRGQLDAWDYQYYLSCWLDGSLAVAPDRNLVSNVGIGSDATHTIEPAPYLNCPAEFMAFPLVHPPFMVCDRVSDQETYKRRLRPEQGSSARRTVQHIQYLLSSRKRAGSVKLVQGRLAERLDRAEATARTRDPVGTDRAPRDATLETVTDAESHQAC
jgi:hypothetical protein